jgi:uncharacterized protein
LRKRIQVLKLKHGVIVSPGLKRYGISVAGFIGRTWKETKPMRLLPVLSLCVLLNAPLAAMADTPAPKPEHTIFAQGHGDIKVAPDALNFVLTTEGTANTVAEAQKVAQSKMIKVIDTLKSQEKTLELSKPLKLQTLGVSVYPVHDERNKLHKIIGYKAGNSLRVTAIHSGPKLGDAGSRLMDIASKQGADSVGSLSFYVDDMETPKLKALAEAVQLAKQYADVMAKGLGVTLKGVQSAEGTPQYAHAAMYRSEMMMAKASMADGAAPAPPVETGEVSVTCDVSVRFLIQD